MQTRAAKTPQLIHKTKPDLIHQLNSSNGSVLHEVMSIYNPTLVQFVFEAAPGLIHTRNNHNQTWSFL